MPIKPRRTQRPETADDGQVRVRLSRVRLWLVDLDDTIFNASAGMLAAIHRRMEQYIGRRLDLPPQQAVRLQKDYWRTYGATFVGLQRHHGVAPDEFFEATHGFDLQPYLKTVTGAQRLRAVLARLPGRRVVLTNGPRIYAEGVLRGLRLRGVFDGVVSANDMHICGKWRSKPDPILFAHAAHAFGARPCETCFVDDSPANLAAARALGMAAVWCRGYRNDKPATAAHPWADLVVDNLDALAAELGRRPRGRAG